MVWFIRLGLVGLLAVGACQSKHRGLNQPAQSADAAALPTGGTDGGVADSVAPSRPDASPDLVPDFQPPPPDTTIAWPDLPADVPVPVENLTVSKTGAGSGTITSSPSGIDCGSSCTASFPTGAVVSLTAAADATSVFIGWAGGCIGAGACTVAIGAVQTVIANFDLLPAHPDASPDLQPPPPDTLPALPDAPADLASSFKNLQIANTGAGTGTVTSSPPGINCGSTCSADFLTGTVVTLTPTASATSAFTGWIGQCYGTGTCTLTISVNSWASANFAPQYTFVCDPVSPQDPHGSLLACPAGFGCGPADSLPPASNCVQQSGSAGMYSTCLTQGNCALGYSCTGQYCLKYCFSVDDCPPSSSCFDFFPTPSYAGTTRVGYCVEYGTAGTGGP